MDHSSTITDTNLIIEQLSAKLHDIYICEARRQDNTRHPAAYDALSEPVKEYDRVLARFIMAHTTQEQLIDMLSDPLEDA